MQKKVNRGLIRISKDRLLKALKLPSNYDVIKLKISPMDPTMIDITVEHPDLPAYETGKKLKRIEVEGEEEGKNE